MKHCLAVSIIDELSWSLGWAFEIATPLSFKHRLSFRPKEEISILISACSEAKERFLSLCSRRQSFLLSVVPNLDLKFYNRPVTTLFLAPMRKLKSYGFLLAYLVPMTLPGAVFVWGEKHLTLASWFPLIFLFVILPILDYALGRDKQNPLSNDKSVSLEEDYFFRIATWLAVPIYGGLLVWSIHAFSTTSLSNVAKIGWILSQGIIGGVIAINIAHELIHKDSKFERVLGGVLLSMVNYTGFKIEHLRGHHVHVSTPADASSARFNLSVYPFVANALIQNTGNAWKLEFTRLQKLGRSKISVHNELIQWQILVMIFAMLAGWLGGWIGFAFFFAQGLFAAISLEIINYIEHYGLERERDANGKYARVTHLHSWNSSYRLSNWILFQLQRHSDHHETPRRRYQALLHHDDSPQLPGGYASMFVLALIPPLWKSLINPRVVAQISRG